MLSHPFGLVQSGANDVVVLVHVVCDVVYALVQDVVCFVYYPYFEMMINCLEHSIIPIECILDSFNSHLALPLK